MNYKKINLLLGLSTTTVIAFKYLNVSIVNCSEFE